MTTAVFEKPAQLPLMHWQFTYEKPHSNLSACRNTKSMGRIDHLFDAQYGTAVHRLREPRVAYADPGSRRVGQEATFGKKAADRPTTISPGACAKRPATGTIVSLEGSASAAILREIARQLDEGEAW